MRIIGYIPDSEMKITLLAMNQRLSIKFEWGLMEQTYKLHLSPEDLREEELFLIPKDMRERIIDVFQQMHHIKQAMESSNSEPEIDFPTIL